MSEILNARMPNDVLGFMSASRFCTAGIGNAPADKAVKLSASPLAQSCRLDCRHIFVLHFGAVSDRADEGLLFCLA